MERQALTCVASRPRREGASRQAWPVHPIPPSCAGRVGAQRRERPMTLLSFRRSIPTHFRTPEGTTLAHFSRPQALTRRKHSVHPAARCARCVRAVPQSPSAAAIAVLPAVKADDGPRVIDVPRCMSPTVSRNSMSCQIPPTKGSPMTTRRNPKEVADDALQLEREGEHATAQALRRSLEETEARKRWERESRRPAETMRRGYLRGPDGSVGPR